jgi:hypothetical protein
VTTLETPEHRVSVLDALRVDARLVAAALAAGAFAGLVLAGVGGRLAMRIITLTSDPSVRGMVTDDGFVTGQFDPWLSIRFVVTEGVPTGVAAALAWLAVRPFLAGPTWIKHVSYAGTLGLWFGAVTVHADSIDFTTFGPVWLSVLLFGLGPALVFLATSLAVERATRPDGWFTRGSERRALAPLLILLVSPFILPLLVAAAVVSAVRHLVRRASVLAWITTTHPVPLWSGRAALVALFTYSAISLTRDTYTLLSLAG